MIEQDKILIDDSKIKRVLEWFEKKGSTFIGEEEITNIGLLELRKIFGLKDPFPDGNVEIPYRENYDPYMDNCYVVTEKHAKLLQPYINHAIDLNKYDYFVGAFARET